MIEISNLTRLYGAQKAVDDVTLTINAGEIVAIVGTSGSGKTTLMRMIDPAGRGDAGCCRKSAHLLMLRQCRYIRSKPASIRPQADGLQRYHSQDRFALPREGPESPDRSLHFAAVCF